MFENFSLKASTLFLVDAKVSADTIRSLQKTLGKNAITAKGLLDDSRDENVPLHSCFEWDNDVAAKNYRLYQSCKIINSIVLEIVKDDKPPITTRLFVNVQPVAPKKQGEFVAFDVALGNKDYRQQVLNNAQIELRAFQRARLFQIIRSLRTSAVITLLNDNSKNPCS